MNSTSGSWLRGWILLHLLLSSPLFSQPQVLFEEGFDGEIFPPDGWTVVNRDSGLLAPWFRGTALSVIPPFEGTGFAANNFQRANGNYLDDYLITPSIPGIGGAGFADSLIFMARSLLYAPPTVGLPDSLMILVSVTGSDTSDFATVLDYFEVPKDRWTRQGYILTGNVPANSTIHIAFRYLHYNGGETGTSSDFVGVDAVRVGRSTSTGVAEATTLPTAFTLQQNYPNPFNSETRIQFSIGNSQYTILKVYDMMGSEVATLVDGQLNAGSHSVVWDARGSASGVYFYRLRAGRFSATGRMVQMK